MQLLHLEGVVNSALIAYNKSKFIEFMNSERLIGSTFSKISLFKMSTNNETTHSTITFHTASSWLFSAQQQ